MGDFWLHEIGNALQGLSVKYYPGWETRSRSSGGFDRILGIAIHHTASNASPVRDMDYMWNGSPSKPVGNIYLGRDAGITVGCAGASNTQGKGGPLNCSKGTVPLDKGNQYMIAIEAANAGTGEPWPKVQTDMYIKLVRQLCDYYRLDYVKDVYGHFDYCAPSCPGRKIDPAGPSPFGTVNASQTWDIRKFRAALPLAMPIPPTPTPEPEEVNMLILNWKNAAGADTGFLDSGTQLAWLNSGPARQVRARNGVKQDAVTDADLLAIIKSTDQTTEPPPSLTPEMLAAWATK